LVRDDRWRGLSKLSGSTWSGATGSSAGLTFKKAKKEKTEEQLTLGNDELAFEGFAARVGEADE